MHTWRRGNWPRMIWQRRLASCCLVTACHRSQVCDDCVYYEKEEEEEDEEEDEDEEVK